MQRPGSEAASCVPVPHRRRGKTGTAGRDERGGPAASSSRLQRERPPPRAASAARFVAQTSPSGWGLRRPTGRPRAGSGAMCLPPHRGRAGVRHRPPPSPRVPALSQAAQEDRCLPDAGHGHVHPAPRPPGGTRVTSCPSPGSSDPFLTAIPEPASSLGTSARAWPQGQEHGARLPLSSPEQMALAPAAREAEPPSALGTQQLARRLDLVGVWVAVRRTPRWVSLCDARAGSWGLTGHLGGQARAATRAGVEGHPPRGCHQVQKSRGGLDAGWGRGQATGKDRAQPCVCL